MLRAVLSLVSALFSSLPELLKMAREWKAAQDAEADRLRKNARNAEAIAKATKAGAEKNAQP